MRGEGEEGVRGGGAGRGKEGRGCDGRGTEEKGGVRRGGGGGGEGRGGVGTIFRPRLPRGLHPSFACGGGCNRICGGGCNRICGGGCNGPFSEIQRDVSSLPGSVAWHPPPPHAWWPSLRSPFQPVGQLWVAVGQLWVGSLEQCGVENRAMEPRPLLSHTLGIFPSTHATPHLRGPRGALLVRGWHERTTQPPQIWQGRAMTPARILCRRRLTKLGAQQLRLT